MTDDEITRSYKTCFESDAGKVVLDDLKRRCFFVSQTHVVDHPDMTAFNNGKRDALLEILYRVEKDLTQPQQEFTETKEQV